MVSAPNSLKPAGPMTRTMPESSRRVCVLNGSRQVDRVIKGEWTTLKVLPESDLSRGIYQLGETTKTSGGKDTSFTGQVLFSNGKAVYQLSGKGVAEYPRSTFVELEAKGEKVVDSHSYTMAYANGKGVANNARAANATQPWATSKGYDASM